MADATDLKSVGETHVGSSPTPGTKRYFSFAVILAFIAISACSNSSLQNTIDRINRSYQYESKARALYADLDKDTNVWNNTVNELTKIQESIADQQAAKQVVTSSQLDSAQDVLDKLQDIREREDQRLAVSGGYVIQIQKARNDSTEKIKQLKKSLNSRWSTDFVDASLEINKQKVIYFSTMQTLYAEIWEGSHLQIKVAEAKMRLQIKANGSDVDTYNEAVREWNSFTSEINPEIESNTREVQRLKEAVSRIESGIEKLQNSRSAIARDNSVRALFERDMELADLK